MSTPGTIETVETTLDGHLYRAGFRGKRVAFVDQRYVYGHKRVGWRRIWTPGKGRKAPAPYTTSNAIVHLAQEKRAMAAYLPRYAATDDGRITYHGADLATVMELPAAEQLSVQLGELAADPNIAATFGVQVRNWADDLSSAIRRAKETG